MSNDNPCSEALFRTCKYRPDWPTRGFATKAQAQSWVKWFADWYNGEPPHSATRFVTPNSRHTSRELENLNKRSLLCAKARASKPERWSGPTRNWQPTGPVWLNPVRSTTPVKMREAA